MAAYVEKDRLIGFLKSLPQGENSDISIRTVIEIVAKFIPFIVTDNEKVKSGEFKPVIHASWIPGDWCDKCSNCGYNTGKYESPSKYCPFCGAKMDEEVKRCMK